MQPDSPAADATAARRGALPGELLAVWTVWFTYGSFYFCRTNLSAALPGIEADLGYTKTQMATALLSLKIAYGCGQFVNGQLAERFSARWMLAIGMCCSAGLNIAFGFLTGLYFFIFVWACNGYAQSLGWTPCVRVLGNWVPVHRRGRAIGFVGTGYQITLGLTYLVSGFGVSLLGWQGALWLPPAILLTAAALMLLLLRESPRDGDETHPHRAAVAASPRQHHSFLDNLRLTLSNPALWLLALSLGMLNACRYGFLDWGISHLVAAEQAPAQRAEIETALRSADLTAGQQTALAGLLEGDLLDESAQKQIDTALEEGVLPGRWREETRSDVLKSAVKYAVLPIGAILGSFLAGWATDRLFGGRRIPVICALLVALGALTLIYDDVARSSFAGTMGVLMLVGFCIYGPQVLLVGTAPADLARGDTAAAAAGFVNCVGYFGAAFAGDLLTGYLADHYGWRIAIYFWAGWAFAAASTAALLWNAKGSAQGG